jgi:hypothetical protein
MADAFESAEGMVKQVLTLATGSIGAIIVLFEDDKLAGVQLAGSSLLLWAIGLLALSAATGVLTLGAITAQLAEGPDAADPNAHSVRYPAVVQLVAFAAGLVAVAVEVVRG